MNRSSWIGQTLGGRYRIDEIIGQGGMSAVYKAYDPNLKRVVAVKLIHSHLADDPRFLMRFEEEAAAVAQLRHPNIVQVYDFNHDSDIYYMVQEFLTGETLQDRLRRLNKSARRLPLKEALSYTVNICDAAGYAHKRGMIHRDIKPANTMLDVHGQAILMDFGIVKITGSDRHTTTGAVVGTALYLSPEVIRGETPDARSDLYALGVTLYEMVSGRPPFEADSAMTLMMMHLNDPVPDLRGLRPEVPDALIKVIEKALSKDREARYATMAEFAGALRAVQAALPEGPSVQATQADSSTATAAVVAAAVSSPATSDQPAANTILESSVAPATPPGASPVIGATISETPSGAPAAATHAEPTSHTVPASLPLPVSTSHQRPGGKSFLWIGLGALVVIAIVIGVIFTIGNRSNEPASPAQPTGTLALAAVVENTAATQAAPSPTATYTLTPTQTATITPTRPPTAIPSPTPTPLPTIPVGVPYVTIKGIGLDSQGNYIVDYETFEYTEKMPGQHIHFFFNTTPVEQAGNPGEGPWYVWGGPRPFNRFRQVDRPDSATQVCALVANSDHSVRLKSGSCFILPDVNVAAPYQAMACLTGPEAALPPAAQLLAGQLVLVKGLSPDEAWWNVENPTDPRGSCWLERSQTSFQGDLSTLPLVEPPDQPTGMAASGFSAAITNIALDANGRYLVEYTTQGFSEQLPGVHLHFFFDTFSAEQISPSGSGNRLMYGGPAPFTGYSPADRPANAAQMCVLVANPDHTVIPGSGNCFALP